MDDLKQKYADKKSEMRAKYEEVINKIAIARGVDVGVAFEMLLAVCRGGNYIDGIVDTEADDVNEGVAYLDLDELNADYFELASISEQIAKASGLID